MHHLLTLIKTDDTAVKTLCERYAPNYQFSYVNGRYLVLNSELLSIYLQKDTSVLGVLRSGIEAFDTRINQPVDITGADPLYCII
jgi:hypothetical protein